MDVQFKVAIIGAGPAGMTASVYASRQGMDTALIERMSPGGKMVNIFEIENYPGAVNVNGADLSMKMYEQATAFGAQFVYGDVVSIEDGDVKKIHMADGSVLEAENVIIATGTVERKLGVPGEAEMTGHGVSYCAVCDGAFYRKKTVTVIGGGNSALTGALYLTKFAEKVNIVIRRDQFRATEIVQRQLRENEKINIITKAVPVEILAENNKVCGIVLKNVDSGEQFTVPTDGVFPYIGADPITSFAAGLGLKEEGGYIVTDENMETSVPGIYAIGDVRKKDLRQIVTATSDGAIAAEAIGKKN